MNIYYKFLLLFFASELRAVLSSIESSHKDTDVRQRAWMLCALITHVNTESVTLLLTIATKK